ncbi:MAG: hypothetical protein AAF358_14135 [Pseudomonadota bacterium]
MKYTEDQIATALRNAHNAGDTHAARRLAKMLQDQRQQSTQSGYTREQLESALRNAHNAGDVQAARQLTQALVDMRTQPVQRAQPSAGELGGGSIFDSIGQAALGISDEIAGGVGAVVNEGAKLFGKGTDIPFSDAYREIRDTARRNEAAFADRNPKTALAAELAGGLATGGIGFARTAGAKAGGMLANSPVIKSTLLTGLQGGAYGYGSSDEESAEGLLRDTAAGSLLGGFTGAAVPTVAKGVSRALKPNQLDEAAQVLENAGVNSLTRSQRLGNDAAQGLEGTLEKIPVIGKPLADARLAQRKETQSAIMRMAGFQADDVAEGLVNDKAVNNAKAAFSKRYSDALTGKKLDLGSDEFLDGLANTEAKHAQFIGPNQKRELKSVVDELMAEASGGPVDALKAHEWRSFFGDEAWSLRDSNPKLAGLYRDIRELLDDQFEKVSPGELKGLNREYGRFRQVQDTYVTSGGTSTAEGIIPLAGLERRSKKSNLKDTEWRELINAAQQVLPDKLPDSGTASRQATLKLASSLIGPSAGTAYFSGSLTGGLAPAGLALAGRATSSLLAGGKMPISDLLGTGPVRALRGGISLLGNRPSGLLVGPPVYAGTD